MNHPSPSYEEDFPAWLDCQIKLIKSGEFQKLDVDHLLEEMEDLGNHRDTIQRLWALTLQHMLKWKYQPGNRSNSWKKSILVHSKNAAKKFYDNPCNKHHMKEMFSDAYEEACAEASNETGIEEFPIVSEWTAEQILDKNFIEVFLGEGNKHE